MFAQMLYVILLALCSGVICINPDNPFLNNKNFSSLDIRKIYPNNPFFRTFSAESTTRATVISGGNTAVCGQVMPTVNQLIFHGYKTRKGEWPWIVAIFALKRKEEFICGGNLINKRYVISAAHCFKNTVDPQLQNPSSLLTYLGIFDITRKHDPNVQRKKVADIYLHPEYEPRSYINDIGVLQLSSTVEYTAYVRPICLWTQGSDLRFIVGKKGTIIGWGQSELQRQPTDEPLQIDLPIVSQEDCLHSNPQFKYITSSNTFCAGLRNNSGPCNGDSGNGFILRHKVNNESRWFLRGITSLSLDNGDKMCNLKDYIVFTDVAKYKLWLQDILKED